MNWIGGARNRVKFRGERKLQQEFFERQRMSAAANTVSKRKKRLSQDLVALHTVCKIHSSTPAASAARRPIKHLDLEKFRSCTRSINEVDMGPISPSETPSKLHLNDGQTDKKSDGSSSKSFLNPSEANLMSCKPGTVRETSEHRLSKQKTFHVPLGHTDRSISDQDANTKEYTTKFTNLPNDHLNFSFSNSKHGYQVDIQDAKRKYDAFVSEDFQITPIDKYKKAALKHEHKNRKHTHHNKEIDILNDKSYKNVPQQPQPDMFITGGKKYRTSTPLLDDIKDKTSESKQSGHSAPGEQSFKSLESISPIIPDRKRLENIHDDDFRFKPRYMYASLEHSQSDKDSTKSLDMNSKTNLTESVFHESVSTIHSSFSVSSFMPDGKMYSINEERTQHNQFDMKTPYKQIHRTTDNNPRFCSALSTKDKNRNDQSTFEDFQPISMTSNTSSPLLGKHEFVKRFDSDLEIVNADEKSKLTVKEKQNHNQGKQHIPMYSRSERTPQKSYYGTDDDFKYQPRARNEKSFSRANGSVMDLYKNAVGVHLSSGSSSVIKDTFNHVGIGENPGSESYLRNMHSPVPADEFPDHLMLPSNQNEESLKDIPVSVDVPQVESMKERIPEFIPDAENRTRKLHPSESSQLSSFSDVKVNSHLEDLLSEMKHLEDQSAGSQIEPDTNSYLLPDPQPVPSKSVHTDSQEADAVTEMEDKLLQSDIEFHLQTASVEKTDVKLNQDTNHEVLPNQTLLSDQLENEPMDKSVSDDKPNHSESQNVPSDEPSSGDTPRHSESQLDKLKVEMTSISQQTYQPTYAEIGTQTMELSPKVFTSIGTSPHKVQEEDHKRHCSVGTQYELKLVPSLSSLCSMKRLRRL